MGRRSLVAKRVVLVAKKTWTAFESTATIFPTPSDVCWTNIPFSRPAMFDVSFARRARAHTDGVPAPQGAQEVVVARRGCRG